MVKFYTDKGKIIMGRVPKVLGRNYWVSEISSDLIKRVTGFIWPTFTSYFSLNPIKMRMKE